MLGGPVEDHPNGSFTYLRRMLTGASHGSHPLSEWALRPTQYGSDQAGLHLSPVYDAAGVVKSFVPGEHVHSDDEQTHESTESCPRRRIAFLTGDEVGVLNTVRSSKAKATLFLQMLVEIASNEAAQLEPLQAKCDCGEIHR